MQARRRVKVIRPLRYPQIASQLALLLVGTGLFLVGFKYFARFCHREMAPRLGLETCVPSKALSSLLWFGVGYAYFLFMRGKVG